MGVQCYELFGGIAHKNHVFIITRCNILDGRKREFLEHPFYVKDCI